MIATIGLRRISGVTALLSPVGTIAAGHRMFSVFQYAGGDLIGLVADPEDKKAERKPAQNGVIFSGAAIRSPHFSGIEGGSSLHAGKIRPGFCGASGCPAVSSPNAEFSPEV